MAITKQESAKETGCLQAETRQQEASFVNDICSRLDAMKLRSDDPEENWTVFRDNVLSSAMDSLGPVSCKHQGWFDENDEEIQGLLEEKNQKHKAQLSDTSSVYNKAVYSNIRKTVQTRLRDMQDSWLSSKTDDIQSFAGRKVMKKFFDALKTVYGPQSSETTHLLSADGKRLSWKDGLSTLIVFLIGHHLSMMTLSTDYHKWNVICCLTSSQPSLKQWKQ